jgi:hypothetical protein
MGLVDAIPLLTPTEARQVVEAVHAARPLWNTRDAATEFHTLGAASYLDARDGHFDAYQAYARAMNAVLTDRFGPLLERVRAAFAAATGAVVRYDARLALPGFHIFLYHPDYASSRASVHYDLQYEHIDWSGIGVPDTASQRSLTLTLALPASGGGLLVWNINRLEIMQMSPEQRVAHSRAHRHAEQHPYSIGTLVIHSGHQLHQIAGTKDGRPGDARITLQAHALRVDGEWVMYW